jgi:mannose-6-phosphate isomerase-like protein (cupin superfamily)
MGKDQADLHASAQVVRAGDVEPTPLSRDRGRQWQLVAPADGSSIDLHRIELRPGSVPGHYHVHTRAENVYVLLEGVLDIQHPSGTTRLQAGDAIRFPPGVPHSARCVGGEPAVLLEIYFPAPADFVRVEDEVGHEARRS